MGASKASHSLAGHQAPGFVPDLLRKDALGNQRLAQRLHAVRHHGLQRVVGDIHQIRPQKIPRLEGSTLADKKEGATGLFLIDSRGMVKKGTRQGSTCRSTDGNKYKVVKESEQDEKYGWHIYIVDEDEKEEETLIPVTDDMADYIHWDAVEG